MPSKDLEYHCTGLESLLEGWNALDRVGIPLYRVGVLSKELVCGLQGWNALERDGIHLYRVGMFSKGLVCL
jgi:hypothetical protein